MLFNLKRFTSIEKRVKVLSKDKIGNHKDHDYFDFERNAVEDIKFLIDTVKNLSSHLEILELDWQKKSEKIESYEHLFGYKAQQASKLLTEKILLENDKQYLVDKIMSIERISTQGQKHNADLQQINDICNEALEETEEYGNKK